MTAQPGSEDQRVAFVLSGGGNYGALQAGALQVFLEADIRPDLLVGTSAGALNAVFTAVGPTPSRVRQLEAIWCDVQPEDVGARLGLTAFERLMNDKRSIYESQPLADFLQSHLPASATTFGDLDVPAYTVAARLSDGAMRVFGDAPDERLVDGMMASCAIVPFYPPWRCDDASYVDGGFLTSLPLMIAVDRGATDIYAFDIQDPLGSAAERSAMIEVTAQAISLMMVRELDREREQIDRMDVSVRTVQLEHGDVGLGDFTRGEELVARGREAAMAALNS